MVMFGSLTKRLASVFDSLKKVHRIGEKDILDAVKQVRLALLDADVNYSVVKLFISRVKERVLGFERLKQLSAGDRFIEIVHEELSSLMTSKDSVIFLGKKPSVFLLCGLQGSGKTTTCAKLAAFLKVEKDYNKVLLVPCDLKRPAAVEQLRVLADKAGVAFYEPSSDNACRVAEDAMEYAAKGKFDGVIFDTAGRLHLDEDLMDELRAIKACVKPAEVLFVANAALGQDAATSSQVFDRSVGLTGIIVTMVDGDARAGCSLSMVHMTEKPIKLEGCGERLEDLRVFIPESMADRILGMGDALNLIREAKKVISEEENELLAQKLTEASFNYNDYLKQVQAFRRMGPLRKLMAMMPGGAPSDEEMSESEKEFSKKESIIFSMTPEERSEKVELTISRIKRIASGSGTTIGDVNQLKKQMQKAKEFFKDMNPEKMKKLNKKMTGGSNKWL